MNKKIHQTIGWCGVVAILLAYALNNWGAITVHTYTYQLLNLFGGAAIVFDSWQQKNYPPAALNAIWAIIAVIAIIRLFF